MSCLCSRNIAGRDSTFWSQKHYCNTIKTDGSLNDAFSVGDVYKFHYEIDDGYDESIGFQIDKVEKHF